MTTTPSEAKDRTRRPCCPCRTEPRATASALPGRADRAGAARAWYWATLDPAHYAAELHPLVAGAVHLARTHSDDYLRHRVELQVADPED